MPAPTPKLLSLYRDKEPTEKHVRMAKWIKANGGGEIDPKAIQVVLAADGKFQTSEENQAFLAKRREEIELEKQAKLERAEQRAERRAAKALAAEEAAERKAASPKAATPPVKKAPKAAKASAPATKAATKAPATKAAAKSAKPKPKRPTAKSSNFDDADF